VDKINQIERKRIHELEQLIEEKKEELLNYKNNLALQSKIKDKLKGESVGEAFLIGEKPKRKKK
jgi:ribosomal protein L29